MTKRRSSVREPANLAPGDYFDAGSADHVCEFFERYLRHTKGRWAGKEFALQGWQRDEILRPVFGWKRADGTRKFRIAYIELPRKNGKSTLGAGIALYLLCADGELGAEVYGAAFKREQAAIVFRVAASMVRQSRALRRRLRVIDSQKRILHLETDSFYAAIPRDAAGAFGFNASGCIFDEVHVQPDDELWNVLTQSTVAREQPLTVAITTAGEEEQSLCGRLHHHATQVAAGVVQDPSFFSFIAAAPQEMDMRDRRAWVLANPGLGVTVPESYLRDQANRAVAIPAFEDDFRQFHLNQWRGRRRSDVPLELWDTLGGIVDEKALRGRRCWGALDLAQTVDFAACTLVFPPERPEDEGRYQLVFRFWLPADMRTRTPGQRETFRAWARDGYVQLTEGAAIDFDAIKLDILGDEERRGLCDQYRVQEFAVDRFNALELMQKLEKAGLTVFAHGQGFVSMTPAVRALLQLARGDRLRHGGHPVMRWMVSNVLFRRDPAGNLKPDRERSRDKIDGVVTTVMAVGRALVATDTPKRRWAVVGE